MYLNASKYNMLTTTQNKIISYESTVHQYMIVNHAFFAVLYNIFTIFHFSFIIHSFNKIKETKKPSFYQERDILFPDRGGRTSSPFLVDPTWHGGVESGGGGFPVPPVCVASHPHLQQAVGTEALHLVPSLICLLQQFLQWWINHYRIITITIKSGKQLR